MSGDDVCEIVQQGLGGLQLEWVVKNDLDTMINEYDSKLLHCNKSVSFVYSGASVG